MEAGGCPGRAWAGPANAEPPLDGTRLPPGRPLSIPASERGIDLLAVAETRAAAPFVVL